MSWVILNRETMQPVLEIYNPELLNRLNTEKYIAMPTLQWLHMFDVEIKEKITLH